MLCIPNSLMRLAWIGYVVAETREECLAAADTDKLRPDSCRTKCPVASYPYWSDDCKFCFWKYTSNMTIMPENPFIVKFKSCLLIEEPPVTNFMTFSKDECLGEHKTKIQRLCRDCGEDKDWGFFCEECSRLVGQTGVEEQQRCFAEVTAMLENRKHNTRQIRCERVESVKMVNQCNTCDSSACFDCFRNTDRYSQQSCYDNIHATVSSGWTIAAYILVTGVVLVALVSLFTVLNLGRIGKQRDPSITLHAFKPGCDIRVL